MKKVFWIFFFWTVALLLSLVAGLGSSPNRVGTEDYSIQRYSEKHSYYSLNTSDRISQAIKAETYVTVANTISSPAVKRLFWTFTKALDQVFYARFTQYCFYAQNKITRLTPTDLIFPFHYFW